MSELRSPMSHDNVRRLKLIGLAGCFWLVGVVSWVAAGSFYRWAPYADWLLFAVVLGNATTWPAILLLGALARASGVEASGAAFPVALAVLIGFCSFFWAWAITSLPIMGPSDRRRFALTTVALILLSAAPLLCWWSGSAGCPEGLRRLGDYQAMWYEDQLYMGNAPDRSGAPTPADLAVRPAILVQVSAAGVLAAAANGLLWASLLAMAVAIVQRVASTASPRQPEVRQGPPVARPLPAPVSRRPTWARPGLWLAIAAILFVIAFPVAAERYEKRSLSRSAAEGDVVPVETWSDYADIAAFESAIRRVVTSDANDMRLAFAHDPFFAGDDGAALAIAYHIGAPPPNDYVGFQRDLDPPADWRGWGAASFFAWGDPVDRGQVIFQLRETSGELWRSVVPLPPVAGGVLRFAFDSLELAPSSPRGNGELDLGAVDQYGIEIGHAGPGVSGTLTLGTNFLEY